MNLKTTVKMDCVDCVEHVLKMLQEGSPVVHIENGNFDMFENIYRGLCEKSGSGCEEWTAVTVAMGAQNQSIRTNVSVGWHVDGTLDGYGVPLYSIMHCIRHDSDENRPCCQTMFHRAVRASSESDPELGKIKAIKVTHPQTNRTMVILDNPSSSDVSFLGAREKRFRDDAVSINMRSNDIIVFNNFEVYHKATMDVSCEDHCRIIRILRVYAGDQRIQFEKNILAHITERTKTQELETNVRLAQLQMV